MIDDAPRPVIAGQVPCHNQRDSFLIASRTRLRILLEVPDHATADEEVVLAAFTRGGQG